MRKYDDFDFHARAAEESGQDSENGFTHIGFFLSWMLRRGLGDPSVFGSQVAGELRSGRMRANDLRDLVNGQLLSSMATTIGSEFLDAYYLGGYSADFDAEFSSSAPYSVTDDPDYQTRIDRRLDSAFESWVAAGQPSSDSPTALWHTAPPPTDIAAAAAQAAAELAGTVTVSPISDAPQAHRDPVLETRVARAISVSSPVHSYTVRDWDSSTLNRALKSLGISTKDATEIGRAHV